MEYIERFAHLLSCTSSKSWQESIFRLGKGYGFEHTLFGLAPQRATSLEGSFIRGNFSAQWLDVYERKQYIRVDPRISHCENRFVPLLWEPAVFSSREQKEMYEEASAYGLCSGVALPMHTGNGKFGMLYFATKAKPSRRMQREIIKMIPELSVLRDFALESSMSFVEVPSLESAPVLTPNELECLKWCAAGKSSWEIARLLNCAEATVNFHFSNVRRKFKTSSRNHAVVKAIQMGLLNGI